MSIVKTVETDLAAAEKAAVAKVEAFIAKVKAEGAKVDAEAKHLLHLIAGTVTSHL